MPKLTTPLSGLPTYGQPSAYSGGQVSILLQGSSLLAGHGVGGEGLAWDGCTLPRLYLSRDALSVLGRAAHTG